MKYITIIIFIIFILTILNLKMIINKLVSDNVLNEYHFFVTNFLENNITIIIFLFLILFYTKRDILYYYKILTIISIFYQIFSVTEQSFTNPKISLKKVRKIILKSIHLKLLFIIFDLWGIIAIIFVNKKQFYIFFILTIIFYTFYLMLFYKYFVKSIKDNK